MKNLQLIITLFCLAISAVVFGQMPISIEFTNIQPCINQSNGQIFAIASGGTQPYLYKWSNGNQTSVVSGLAPGIYTLTVTDLGGKVLIAKDTLKELAPINLKIEASEPTICNNPVDILITVGGGVSSFYYDWNNGSTNKNKITTNQAGGFVVTATSNNGCQEVSNTIDLKKSIDFTYKVTPVLSGSAGKIEITTINGLAIPPNKYTIYMYAPGSNVGILPDNNNSFTANKAGNYTIKVSDNLCSETKIISVNDEGLKVNIKTTKSDCNKANGSADIFVSGGQPPYAYKWSNGVFTPPIDKLGFGKYSVTITSADSQVKVVDIEILGNLKLDVEKISPCDATEGSLDVKSVSGGKAPYTYSWYNSTWANPITFPKIDSIKFGSYTITVSDANGCSSKETYEMSFYKTLQVSTSNVFDGCPTVKCNNGNGVPPYTYKWSNGASTQSVDTYKLLNINYTVTATDSKGCTGASSIFSGIPSVFYNITTCGNVAAVTSLCSLAKYTCSWYSSVLPNGTVTGNTITFKPNTGYGIRIRDILYNITYDDTLYVKKITPCSNFIKGNIFADVNQNCQKEVGEKGLSSRIVELQPGYSFTTTDAKGNYSFFATPGTYTIGTEPKSLYEAKCNPPITVNLKDSATVDIPLKINTLCPYLNVDISTWILRPCQNNTYTVNYCNNGTALAKNAYVTLDLDKDLTYTFSTIPLTKKVGQLLTFEVGDVAVGECKQFSVTAYLECTNNSVGQTHCVKAHIFPDSLCNSPANPWSGAKVEVTGKCDTKDVILTIKNTGSKAMAATKNYLIIEDEVIYKTGTFKLNPNEAINVKMPANGKTYRIEAEQELNFPTEQSKPSAWVEACGNNAKGKFSIGYVNKFPKDDADPFTSIYCRESVASYDPNEKIAFPSGAAAQHFVLQNTDIEYELHFQNEGTDTAFTVVLRDTLDKSLNVNTLQTGASSHSYTWKVSGNGILTFTFDKINLTTKKQNEPKSQGFVKYRIAQNKDNALGTVIKNRAGIYFDINPVILTNTTTHTIGKDFLKVTGVNTPDFPDVKVRAYPNPFEQAVTFSIENLENPSNETLHFYLFDFSGKVIKQAIFNENQLFLPRENISNGVYFYQIKLGEKVVQNGKLVAVE